MTDLQAYVLLAILFAINVWTYGTLARVLYAEYVNGWRGAGPK